MKMITYVFRGEDLEVYVFSYRPLHNYSVAISHCSLIQGSLPDKI